MALHNSGDMMTSWNGNIFHVTGPLCEEFTGHRWIPLTKARNAELWCFFGIRLNNRLSKQSWGWWFETPSRSLLRHYNEFITKTFIVCMLSLAFESYQYQVQRSATKYRWQPHRSGFAVFILNLFSTGTRLYNQCVSSWNCWSLRHLNLIWSRKKPFVHLHVIWNWSRGVNAEPEDKSFPTSNEMVNIWNHIYVINWCCHI